VHIAKKILKNSAVLTEDEEITALGRVLRSLSVHPPLGKIILLGIIFRCVDLMIILAASLA
jgi:ATP-dependent RNA helicase DHX36